MSKMRWLRGIVTDMTSAAGKIARVDFKIGTTGEEFANREAIQQFGFASNAPIDTPIFALQIGPVVFAIGTAPGAKKPALQPGESALYNDFTEVIKLADGRIAMTTPEINITASASFTAEAPDIKLGAAAVNKLIDERLIVWLETHYHQAHNYPPTQPIAPGSVTTSKTKAE